MDENKYAPPIITMAIFFFASYGALFWHLIWNANSNWSILVTIGYYGVLYIGAIILSKLCLRLVHEREDRDEAAASRFIFWLLGIVGFFLVGMFNVALGSAMAFILFIVSSKLYLHHLGY